MIFAVLSGVTLLINSISSSPSIGKNNENKEKSESSETEITLRKNEETGEYDKMENTCDFYDCCQKINQQDEKKFGFLRNDFLKKKEEEIPPLKFYSDQIFICSGKKSTSWERNEHQKSFAKELTKELRKIQDEEKRVIVNLIEDPSTTEGLFDVLCFPSLIRYNKLNSKNDLIKLVDEHYNKGNIPVEGFDSKKLQGVFVFVCCHNEASKKCGVSGPRIFKKFVLELKNIKVEGLPVTVRRVSCVSGHKYAGNVIIYKYDPSRYKTFGDWFGYVGEDDVSRLIKDFIVEGGSLKNVLDLWRGRSGVKSVTNANMKKFLK